MLDEPTNHLDIATKRGLVRALADYEGTLVFVSHDRQFLSALATRVLELSAAGPRGLRRQLRRVRRVDWSRSAPGHALTHCAHSRVSVNASAKFAGPSTTKK